MDSASRSRAHLGIAAVILLRSSSACGTSWEHRTRDDVYQTSSECAKVGEPFTRTFQYDVVTEELSCDDQLWCSNNHQASTCEGQVMWNERARERKPLRLLGIQSCRVRLFKSHEVTECSARLVDETTVEITASTTGSVSLDVTVDYGGHTETIEGSTSVTGDGTCREYSAAAPSVTSEVDASADATAAPSDDDAAADGGDAAD